jgi:hypothetical protein
VNVQHHLLERSGGHYIDVGGTELIAEGKVAVRDLVEPTDYTETGLRLSDGSILEVDAVVWCTGFVDKNVRTTAKDRLGAEQPGDHNKEDELGPADIAARLDASWGVDAEGEVRGMWKRRLRIENYWVRMPMYELHMRYTLTSYTNILGYRWRHSASAVVVAADGPTDQVGAGGLLTTCLLGDVGADG